MLDYLLGGIDFSGLSYPFGDTSLNTVLFIQTVVDFFIIAFSIFMVIRFLNRFKKKEEEAEVVVEVDKKEELLSEIRDLLRENPQALKGSQERQGE